MIIGAVTLFEGHFKWTVPVVVLIGLGGIWTLVVVGHTALAIGVRNQKTQELAALLRLYEDGERIIRDEKHLAGLGFPVQQGAGVEWMRKIDTTVRNRYIERLKDFETNIDEAVLERDPHAIRVTLAASELTEDRVIEAQEKKLAALASLIEREQAMLGQARPSRSRRHRS